MFEGITRGLAEADGLLLGRQRLDSTHVVPNIAILTRLGLFVETVAARSAARRRAAWSRWRRMCWLSTTDSSVVWQLPTESFISDVLTNPWFAGAFFWGRRPVEVKWQDGRLARRQGRERSPEDHQGYITWEQFEEHRRILSRNNQINSGGYCVAFGGAGVDKRFSAELGGASARHLALGPARQRRGRCTSGRPARRLAVRTAPQAPATRVRGPAGLRAI